MIEASIPHDILKYKTKFIAGFSIRECIFIVLIGIAAVLSITKLFPDMETTAKIYVTAGLVTPIGVVGFVKPYGQPFEKIAFQIIYDNFICPLNRKKEIHYPEYERFRKGLYHLELVPLPEGTELGISRIDSVAEEVRKSSEKKRAKKQDTTGKRQAATKSKTYKAIR